jgi:hypothetical protein
MALGFLEAGGRYWCFAGLGFPTNLFDWADRKNPREAASD